MTDQLRGKKTKVEIASKDINKSKRKRLLSDLSMNKAIKDLVESVADSSSTFNDLLEESDCLDVLNRVQINKFLNIYVTSIFRNLNATKDLNNKLLEKILKKKEVVSPKDYVRLYIKTRELENDQLGLISNFCKQQNVKLDLSEQNIIIIYRSLPPNLQKVLYKTIMEFVRQCPAIQREMAKRQGEAQQVDLESLEPEE